MSEKPTYLGLLNALSLAESAAHEYLNAWIAVTEHDGVRATLQTVTAREGEHGLTFAKRINELGYAVKPKDDPEQAKRMSIAASTTLSDLEKMEKFGLGRGGGNDADKPDFFAKIFFDHTIDIRTGELLGRYICEERDSGRLLRSCYEQLCAEAGTAPSGRRAAPADDDRIAALDAKIDAVCAAVQQLTDIVCAQTTPDGKAKSKTNGSKRKVSA
ncbi:MAG TPA: hypothetical protein VFU93_14010 [Acidimicrobiales bacterium]|nr:hypothetical protein [Acidimicrobiales bacterium]